MKYSLGDKIRILRTMKGYSQKGLATAAGLKQENISYIEQNKLKKEIKPENISRIAKALNMNVEELKSFCPDSPITEITQGAGATPDPLMGDPAINQDKIIHLQSEIIQTLQELYNMYRNKLDKAS